MEIRAQLTVGELCRRAVETQIRQGFPTPTKLSEREALLAKLMLVVTEVAEAAEVLRSPVADTDRLNHLLEELADVFIRTGAIAGALTAPSMFARIVREKLDYNERREYRHGKAI